MHTILEDFAREVAALCQTKIPDHAWTAFLDAYVPLQDRFGESLSTRSLSLAEKKRGKLQRLYRYDARVEPWAGTAHGVIQAVNAYEHHENTVRGTDRAERNMLRTISGDFAKVDAKAWEVCNASSPNPTQG